MVSLDLSRLENVHERCGKTIARCPSCASFGNDSKGEHLFIGADGGYGCIIGCDPKAIFELVGERYVLQSRNSFVIASIKETASPDLLTRIKATFPATLYDLWDSSPIRPDEDVDDAKMFLRIFPADAILWLAPRIFKSGKPEHSIYFRTRAQWETECFTSSGTRIAPGAFEPGIYGRSRENVRQHLFAVVETDEIGDGKLYTAKDDFCSAIRWLREACSWHLSAVVDSGNKSLHAWFKHPGTVEIEQLAKHDTTLGFDSKFLEPSQPWRLPGVNREGSKTRQQLIYLDVEAAP